MDVQIACVCEGAPHANDRVTLRDHLDWHTVRVMRNEIKVLNNGEEAPTLAEILATLTETYLLMGIESWSLVGAKGKALPVSRAAITARLLEANPEQAEIVGDVADELYNPAVILPLVARASMSSPPSPTAVSTSVPMASSTKRPTPLKRSSTTTTRTAGTVTTSLSLGGVSNSSPNSESAA